MKYIFRKKIESLPIYKDIYLCDFCSKSYTTLYLYRIDRGDTNIIPDSSLEDIVWFCSDTCLNCYVLAKGN